MARTITSRVVITADGQVAVAELDQITDAAETADEAIQDLDSQTADPSIGQDTLDDLDRLQREADDLETELDQLDAMRVEPEVDTGQIRRASTDTESLGSTAQRAVGPVRGLTDELGSQAGTAGIAANAMIDGGEAIELLGQRAGLSERMVARLSGALTAAAAGVAAGVVIWQQWTSGARRAAERAEALLKVQEQLAEGRFRQAAEDLLETYGDLFTTLRDGGFSAADVVALLEGETAELDQRFKEFLLTVEAFQQAELARTLGRARTEWQASKDEIAETQETVDELTVALGGTVDAMGEAGQVGGRTFDELDRMAHELRGTIELLQGSISNEQSWERLKTQGETTLDAIAAAFQSAGGNAEDHQAAVDESRRSLIDLRAEVARYAADVLNLPAEMITEIDTQLDEGSVAEVLSKLERLTRTREAVIDVRLGRTPSIYIPGTRPAPGAPSNAEGYGLGGTVNNITLARTTSATELRSVLANQDRTFRVNGYSGSFPL